MGDFFNSKFVTDLQVGKLPPVEVKVSTQTLVAISFAALVTAVIIILVINIFKKL